MTERFVLRFFNHDVLKEYESLDGSVRKLVDLGLAKLRVRAEGSRSMASYQVAESSNTVKPAYESCTASLARMSRSSRSWR